MTAATELRFLAIPGGGSVAELALNRPDAANAFNAAMIRELIAHIDAVGQAARRGECRALLLRGRGKHFSAGADLAWMQAAAKLTYEGNIQDAEQLTHLFEGLVNLPVPTLAVATGAVYGGAVGLVAACDWAVAAGSAKFCLSEVKLGLLPAVILPYLARKMRPGQLRRHGLSGRIFTAVEAAEYGLVEVVADEPALAATVRAELGTLLQAGPEAQAAFKALHHYVQQDGGKQGEHTAAAIAKARTSAAGQAGLAAFFAKTPPPWVRRLGDDWGGNGG
jgi:methylglutaconyl-CoA hydratase